MPELRLHYLNHADVQALALSDAEIIGAVEQGLHAQGLGQTRIEPRMHLVPEPDYPGHFNVLRGYIRPLGLAERWASSGPIWRWLYRARLSFWGRFVFGPALSIHAIASEAIGQLRRGDYHLVPMWLTHGALTVLMLWGVQQVAGIHPLHYLLGVAYPALSIAMVRSYFEHRATADCKHRIAINESSWPMRLLYLNNNFHLVHHDMPGLAWYLLPKAYWPHRDAYFSRCAGFRFGGYAELAWRFGLRPIDAPAHPGLVDRKAP